MEAVLRRVATTVMHDMGCNYIDIANGQEKEEAELQPIRKRQRSTSLLDRIKDAFLELKERGFECSIDGTFPVRATKYVVLQQQDDEEEPNMYTINWGSTILKSKIDPLQSEHEYLVSVGKTIMTALFLNGVNAYWENESPDFAIVVY